MAAGARQRQPPSRHPTPPATGHDATGDGRPADADAMHFHGLRQPEMTPSPNRTWIHRPHQADPILEQSLERYCVPVKGTAVIASITIRMSKVSAHEGVLILAAALMMTLAVIGCGGTSVDVNNGGDALVKWGKPAGGQEPKGVVMLLPGGGWQPNPTAYRSEMPTAAQLQQLGLATVVVGYGEGATGFREVRQVYLQARKRYPGVPVGAHGESAGGNLALMLAAREPGLTCVIGLAAPTDLTALKAQGRDAGLRPCRQGLRRRPPRRLEPHPVRKSDQGEGALDRGGKTTRSIPSSRDGNSLGHGPRRSSSSCPRDRRRSPGSMERGSIRSTPRWPSSEHSRSSRNRSTRADHRGPCAFPSGAQTSVRLPSRPGGEACDAPLRQPRGTGSGRTAPVGPPA